MFYLKAFSHSFLHAMKAIQHILMPKKNDAQGLVVMEAIMVALLETID